MLRPRSAGGTSPVAASAVVPAGPPLPPPVGPAAEEAAPPPTSPLAVPAGAPWGGGGSVDEEVGFLGALAPVETAMIYPVVRGQVDVKAVALVSFSAEAAWLLGSQLPVSPAAGPGCRRGRVARWLCRVRLSGVYSLGGWLSVDGEPDWWTVCRLRGGQVAETRADVGESRVVDADSEAPSNPTHFETEGDRRRHRRGYRGGALINGAYLPVQLVPEMEVGDCAALRWAAFELVSRAGPDGLVARLGIAPTTKREKAGGGTDPQPAAADAAAAGGSVWLWLDNWARSENIGRGGRARREQSVLCEAILVSGAYDQVDVLSLAPFEIIASQIPGIVGAHWGGPSRPQCVNARLCSDARAAVDIAAPALKHCVARMGKGEAEVESMRSRVRNLPAAADVLAPSGLPVAGAAAGSGGPKGRPEWPEGPAKGGKVPDGPQATSACTVAVFNLSRRYWCESPRGSNSTAGRLLILPTRRPTLGYFEAVVSTTLRRHALPWRPANVARPLFQTMSLRFPPRAPLSSVAPA
ncbi:unnamed protein product, partial [Prorocentrum cordatum]